MENLKEQWKPVSEYEDHYEVSDLGRIRAKAVFIPHDGNWDKDQKGYIKKRKVKNQNINRYGYLQIKLCKYGKCRTLTVHRLVAKAFLPNPENHVQVNHKDGNKQNNIVTNIEWISRSGNIQHAWDTGLMDREKISGEKHFNSKLTQADVDVIRTLFGNVTIKKIAEQYNVSPSTISDIKYNRTWVN